MKWLKSAWSPVVAAVLAILAIIGAMSAARHKARADKWRNRSVSIELGNVIRGVENAEEASLNARIHDNIADDRNKKAAARIIKIAENNESIVDILDRWRK